MCGGKKPVWADFRVSGDWRLAYGRLRAGIHRKKIRFLIVSKTLFHERLCFNNKPLFAA